MKNKPEIYADQEYKLCIRYTEKVKEKHDSKHFKKLEKMEIRNHKDEKQFLKTVSP